MSEMKDSTIFKTPYRVASTMDEKTKKAICEIIGIKNVNDIDRVSFILSLPCAWLVKKLKILYLGSYLGHHYIQ